MVTTYIKYRGFQIQIAKRNSRNFYWEFEIDNGTHFPTKHWSTAATKEKAIEKAKQCVDRQKDPCCRGCSASAIRDARIRLKIRGVLS